MKNRVIWITGAALLVILVLLLFRENEVTVYVGIGKSELEGLPLRVSIDETTIFDDTLVNNPYKYHLENVTLNGGLHSVSLATGDGYRMEENFFILFDQHLIIEYYSPCGNKDQCFDIRNRLTEFRVE